MVTNNSINLSDQGVPYYDGLGNFSGCDGVAINYVLTSNGPGVQPAFKDISASGAIKSMPTDDGTGIPSSGVLKILGSTSTDFIQSGLMTHVGATTDEIYLENRLFTTKFIVDPSATIGVRGSYQTITAATAAASSGDSIWIRPGTYTEDFTPKAGVSYFGFGAGAVTIIGKVSINQDGTYYFQDLGFETNGDYCLELTGVNHPTTGFSRCNFTGSNHTILNLATAFGSTDFENCYFDLTTTGIAHFVTNNSGPPTRFGYSILENSAGSSTANINSGLPITLNWSACKSPLQSTINGVWNIANSILNTFATGSTALDIQGTGANGDLNFVTITSGGGICVNIAAGCHINAVNCIFDTNGATMVSCDGTFQYADITNAGSGQTATISGGGTITPLEWLPYATAAATAGASYRGTSSFNSAQFSVSNGFVSLTGASGFPWSDQSSSTTVASNHGYFVTGTCALTLPASPSNGDVVRFFVDGAFTLTITANTGQKIKVATALSSAAGTAANTSSGDAMELIYRSTNTQWEAVSYVGAWNLA